MTSTKGKYEENKITSDYISLSFISYISKSEACVQQVITHTHVIFPSKITSHSLSLGKEGISRTERNRRKTRFIGVLKSQEGGIS